MQNLLAKLKPHFAAMRITANHYKAQAEKSAYVQQARRNLGPFIMANFFLIMTGLQIAHSLYNQYVVGQTHKHQKRVVQHASEYKPSFTTAVVEKPTFDGKHSEGITKIKIGNDNETGNGEEFSATSRLQESAVEELVFVAPDFSSLTDDNRTQWFVNNDDVDPFERARTKR
eukprot:PhM_4_TR12169/c0_g1_i1/m.26175